MLTFGSFPEVSLATARQKREDARKLLSEGKEPSQQRKVDKIASQTAAHNTFGSAAEEYLSKLEEEGKAASTIEKNRWLREPEAGLGKLSVRHRGGGLNVHLGARH